MKINGLSLLEPPSKLPLHLHRADLDAGLAEGASFGINPSRFPNNGDSEISSLAFNTGHFGIRQQFNSIMEVTFIDRAEGRRRGTHETNPARVCRKRLVEQGEITAY